MLKFDDDFDKIQLSDRNAEYEIDENNKDDNINIVQEPQVDLVLKSVDY